MCKSAISAQRTDLPGTSSDKPVRPKKSNEMRMRHLEKKNPKS
jgi:hypothetical protein